MSNRDNFSKATIDVLAKRVSYKCSNPKCRRMTIGASSDTKKATNIGVAAHITAAAPGGPRWDGSLTEEQRKSIDNAIWLCQSCSVLIDRDPELYPIQLLKKWKEDAEKEVMEKLHDPVCDSSLKRNQLLDNENFQKLVAKVYDSVTKYREAINNESQQEVDDSIGLIVQDMKKVYLISEKNHYRDPLLSKKAANLVDLWNSHVNDLRAFLALPISERDTITEIKLSNNANNSLQNFISGLTRYI